MGKELNFWEMSNIDVMEDLSVLTPSAWYESDDCRDDCDCSDDHNHDCSVSIR